MNRSAPIFMKMCNSLRPSIFIFYFIIYFITSYNCEIEFSAQRRSSYYKLFKAINNKICEESTISGKLNYENSILSKFDECFKLEAKVNLANDTYIYKICQQIYYPNSSRNEILWQIKCQWNLDKNEPYYECLNKNILKHNMSEISEITQNNEMDSDIEQNFQMLDCFKSVMNVSLNASNDREVIGHYGFNKFELTKLFEYNKQLLCDKNMRNQSYITGNETQKVDQYFECFNILLSNCLKKIISFNESSSLTNYFNTTIDYLFCNLYEYRFDLSLEAITQKCQFGDIKTKDYYSSQLVDKLMKVVKCQKDALQLSSEEKLAQQRKDDYIQYLYTNYY